MPAISNLNGQAVKIDNNLKLDTIIFLPGLQPANVLSCDIKSCSWANKVYFTDFNIHKKKKVPFIRLFSLDTENYLLDSTDYIIPQMINSDAFHHYDLINIDISSFYILFDFGQFMLIYENNSSMPVLKHVWHYNRFDKGMVRLVGDKLLEYSLYYNGKPTHMRTFSIDKKEKEGNKSLKFDMPEFTLTGPHNWIHSNPSGNLILFAQTTSYQIDIYNNMLEKIGKIDKTNDPHWVKINEKQRNEIKKMGEQTDYISLSHADSSFSRLLSAWFISDSCIITQYTHPQKFGTPATILRYDIWRLLKNGKWELKHNNLIDGIVPHDIFLTKDTYPLFSLQSSIITFMKNKVIVISIGSNINPLNKSYGKYLDMSEKWFEVHNHIIKIAVFTHLL